ncbi:MAG: (2Fe-2S) ferredoxin domain-containing protein [Deltaproteobacteria bacterium]
MIAYKRHFFVCQTHRPEGSEEPSCGARGAAEIYSRLLHELDQRPALAREVAVTACGCLGSCLDGPMILVYPEGTWYAGVSPDDVPELVQSHLANGVVVERLRWKAP